ncbi:MAG: cell division protein FtsZ [Patescibacteria group bacterium]|nr:cell division protein FtsZ [Patescibacteria group bacterium]
MAEIKPDIETFAKIKVIGVGGGGGSAINRMINAKIKGVDFLAVNTDIQALYASNAPIKLHIGKTITRGLGAGMDPEIGRKAAEESQNEIRDILKGADMVFITCGLGGGTGSGASPVIAEIARDLGALTIGIVTKPFSFEGVKRAEVAEEALSDLSDKVDTIISIPNDKILEIIDKKTSLLNAFLVSDNVLHQGVHGIAEIITGAGLINVDFADVKTIMEGAGSSLMGVGESKGENRAVEAAKMAIENPLLDLSIDGARGILFTVSGGSSLTMNEVNEAAKIITQSADSEAKIIFGAIIDENLKDSVRITVVATGFNEFCVKEFKDKTIQKVSDNFKINKVKINVKKEDKEGEEYNNQNIKHKNNIFVEKKQEKLTEEDVVEEKDELDIPAFIRKKMK